MPKTTFRRGVFILTSLACCLLLSSCGRLRLNMADEEERKQMISDTVEKYHKAVYWGNVEQATLYVRPERRRTFAMALSERRKGENIVDMEVAGIEFDHHVGSAQVTSTCRYFKSPTYTVMSRTEEERWGYDPSEGGWLLEESRVLEQGKPYESNEAGGRKTFDSPFKQIR